MANKPTKNLSLEQFENGIQLYQDENLYKFTSDSIRLAKFCTVKHTDNVLDMCAGCGVIGLYMYSLTQFNKLYFNDIQPEMCELISKNIQLNNLTPKSRVICKNLEQMELSEFEKPLDVIVCNPPYFKVNGKLKTDEKIAICRHEIHTNLHNIIKKSAELLKNKGRLYIILPEDRLCEAIKALGDNNLEVKRIQLNTTSNKVVTCLLEAVKGGNVGVKINIVKE